MALSLARALAMGLGVWAAIGLVFALAFAFVGAGRVDRDARSGSLGFRILILPASVALWPLLLLRWVRGSGDAPVEKTAHRRAARARQP
ncbi:MAG TPA: hypothetical protein VK843_08530 [Planctomycetota bacterium]|nr:hypothetical protein [Planctomycetota bacterium]